MQTVVELVYKNGQTHYNKFHPRLLNFINIEQDSNHILPSNITQYSSWVAHQRQSLLSTIAFFAVWKWQ